MGRELLGYWLFARDTVFQHFVCNTTENMMALLQEQSDDCTMISEFCAEVHSIILNQCFRDWLQQ